MNTLKKLSSIQIPPGKAFLVALLLAAIPAYIFLIRPHLELKKLAVETCGEIDGAIVLVAASEINTATNKAARLGFEPAELGDAMRNECPELMDALEHWSKNY